MLVLDCLVSFLAGVFFARQERAGSWHAAMGFAVLGMALPGAILAVWHPEWHAHYLLKIPVSGVGLAAVGSLGIGAACALGHRIGSVTPRVLPLAAVSVSLWMWWSAGRALSWGGRDAYLAGSASPLPASFVALVAVLSLWTGVSFAVARHTTRTVPPASPSSDRPTGPRR